MAGSVGNVLDETWPQPEAFSVENRPSTVEHQSHPRRPLRRRLASPPSGVGGIAEVAEQQKEVRTRSWGPVKASDGDTRRSRDGNVSVMVMSKTGMQDYAVQPVGLMWLEIN